MRFIERVFWKVWGKSFDKKIKNMITQCEKEYPDIKTRAHAIETRMNQLFKLEVNRLMKRGVLKKPVLFWNGQWINCKMFVKIDEKGDCKNV